MKYGRRIMPIVLVMSILMAFIFGNVFSTQVTVSAKTKKSVKSISIKLNGKNVTKKTITLAKGKTAKLVVKTKPTKAKKSVKFTTSKKSVVTVSKTGKVKAKKSGKAKIKVTISGKYKKKVTWVKIKVKDSQSSTQNPASSGKVLVVYFSRTGENYGVGVIKKGNTAIIADMIAEQTGGTKFEIVTVNAYPDVYEECTAVAQKEQEQNARPALKGSLPSLDEYETIFIGYPIWWGDMPMAVYTFLESYDWTGKTVIPFCTHAGSGLSGTAANIRQACAGADVKQGLAIAGTTAQNNREKAKNSVKEWLSGLGYVGN